MKKIICYGDSNTFGYNPVDASRFDENTRWPKLLQVNLGDGYEIIEEGCCDRTGFVYNDKGFLFSAQKHFPKLIEGINDADILILSVGTNDLQFKYDIDNETVNKGLDNLILKAKTKINNIILISPVVLNNTVLNGYFKIQFDKKSIKKSENIGKIYKEKAEKYNCNIFDINEFAKPSDTDGLHYDEAAHKLIAKKLAEYIKTYY